jgi:predicted ArsR family transcriptional regulator
MGLPRYRHGHHPNPLRRAHSKLHRQGYKLVGELAKALGVSQTTLRRMEAEGVIPQARRLEFMRGRSVRVFTVKEVERITRSSVGERWRARHPGRWVR